MESWDARGLSWGSQAREAEEQGRNNSLALENGLLLIKDILLHGGPLASNLRRGAWERQWDIILIFLILLL